MTRLLLFPALVGACLAAEINPPIGPHVNLKPEDLAQASSFTSSDRLVLTPYFYWYDIYSGAHISDADGSDALTDHPPTLTGFSYKSTAWHRGELLDMMAAGVDVALPVYWGEPSQRLAGQPLSEQPWSYSGLPPLVRAREELLIEGKQPPRIGLFYDTSTLQWNVAGQRIDLTTDYGRQWFYESIRDFYSLIPPKHWAMIDGKPVIFLYAAGFASAHDQSSIDYVRAAFARDFGGRVPFIVREISWQVQSENVYAWGGALGLKNPGVASLGPGYDHSAVPGREPLIVPREGGAFFERNWIRFLRKPSNLVVIETWNEYHEGTDVAASKEYGRQYLELNRKYVDYFKQGYHPPQPRGPFSDVKSISVILEATNSSHGLVQFDSADGATAPTEIGGKPCRETAPTVHPGRYVYFRIDDSYKWADTMLVDVEVEYFDAGTGSFNIEYDGSDPNAPFQGAYTASRARITLSDSRQWKLARVRLVEARFLNSQNGGADFRIALTGSTLYLRRVTVKRLGLPDEAGATLRGWQHDFAEPLGPAWTQLGGNDTTVRQIGGMVNLKAADAPAFILARVPEFNGPVTEVLARVRPVVVEPGNEWLGGIALSPDGGVADGLLAVLHRDPSDQPQLALTSAGPFTGPRFNAAWEANRWYWLRVRHETNRIGGYPDFYARLWPADLETPEPDSWTAWWDYYPAHPAPGGLAGLAVRAGQIECDFFLIESDQLPEITVRLSSLKPARARLRALGFTPLTGMQLELSGEPGAAYQIEVSVDLLAWVNAALSADSTGVTRFEDTSAVNLSRRFYRARLAP